MGNKDLIVLEQLPIITERLDELSLQIKEKVNNAINLVCSEETVKDVKKVRADLTKDYKELEEQRKIVKNAIMDKYKAFEEIYLEKVGSLYQMADNDLKKKIDDVENSLKQAKKEELVDFANEYIAINELQSYTTFNDIPINITLSASMKSLKEEIVAYCERIKQDIELIKLEEYKNEILVEYQNTKDFAKSKINVIERHKQLEEIEKNNQKSIEVETLQQEMVKEVEEVLVPREVEEEITLSFTVTATKTKLKELKQWLIDNGVKYE